MGLGKKTTTSFIVSALGIVSAGVVTTLYRAAEAAKKCAATIPPMKSISFNVQIPTQGIPVPGLPSFFNVSASLSPETETYVEKARELLSEFCRSSTLVTGATATTLLVVAAAVVAGTAYLYFRDTPASTAARDQGPSSARLELATYGSDLSPAFLYK